MAMCSIPAHPIINHLHLEPPLPADLKGRKGGILDQPVDRALGDDEVIRHLLHRDQLAFVLFLFRHEHVFPPRKMMVVLSSFPVCCPLNLRHSKTSAMKSCEGKTYVFNDIQNRPR